MVSEEAYNETFSLVKALCYNLELLVSTHQSKRIADDKNDRNALFLPLYASNDRKSRLDNEKDMLHNLLLVKDAVIKMDNLLIEHFQKRNSNILEK